MKVSPSNPCIFIICKYSDYVVLTKLSDKELSTPDCCTAKQLLSCLFLKHVKDGRRYSYYARHKDMDIKLYLCILVYMYNKTTNFKTIQTIWLTQYSVHICTHTHTQTHNQGNLLEKVPYI